MKGDNRGNGNKPEVIFMAFLVKERDRQNEVTLERNS